jgi:glycine hydroxymethyltransferase
MKNTALKEYLAATDPAALNTGVLAYLASLEEVAKVAPSIARAIVYELRDQRKLLIPPLSAGNG